MVARCATDCIPLGIPSRVRLLVAVGLSGEFMTPTANLASTDVGAENLAAPAAEAGPFVLNLCSSTTPMALAQSELPELKRFTFFVSRRFEEGRERFRLHMGFFARSPKPRSGWARCVISIPARGRARHRARSCGHARQRPRRCRPGTPSVPRRLRRLRRQPGCQHRRHPLRPSRRARAPRRRPKSRCWCLLFIRRRQRQRARARPRRQRQRRALQ